MTPVKKDKQRQHPEVEISILDQDDSGVHLDPSECGFSQKSLSPQGSNCEMVMSTEEQISYLSINNQQGRKYSSTSVSSSVSTGSFSSYSTGDVDPSSSPHSETGGSGGGGGGSGCDGGGDGGNGSGRSSSSSSKSQKKGSIKFKSILKSKLKSKKEETSTTSMQSSREEKYQQHQQQMQQQQQQQERERDCERDRERDREWVDRQRGRVHFQCENLSDFDVEGASGHQDDHGKEMSDSDQVAVREDGTKIREKSLFKEMLRPLRRTKSAGCSKDVPPHALFLQFTQKTTSNETDSDSETEEKKEKKKKSTQSSLSSMKQRAVSFLKRRNTESNLLDKSIKPTREEALKWSESFENLLSHKYGLALFRGFLRTEFSEENIEFWLACEEYKHVKQTSKQATKAKQIYSDFVAIQSPKEVNLDSTTRDRTAEHLNNPTKSTFDICQKRIQALMEKDSYQRFLKSDIYLELIGESSPI